MFPRSIEMKDLTICMNARIGPACTNGPDWTTKNISQGKFNLILHRLTICLLLPTVKLSAIVCTNNAIVEEIGSLSSVEKIAEDEAGCQRQSVRFIYPFTAALTQRITGSGTGKTLIYPAPAEKTFL